MSKTTIAKAILNASEEKPTEFKRNIESVVAEKMKTKLSTAVKAAELKVFK
jgi:hypothetical protein